MKNEGNSEIDLQTFAGVYPGTELQLAIKKLKEVIDPLLPPPDFDSSKLANLSSVVLKSNGVTPDALARFQEVCAQFSSELKAVSSFKNSCGRMQTSYEKAARSLSLALLEKIEISADTKTSFVAASRQFQCTIESYTEAFEKGRKRAQQKRRKLKGGRPSTEWRYEQVLEIAVLHMKNHGIVGPYAAADIIIDVFGFTGKKEVWQAKAGLIVWGNTRETARKRLGEKINKRLSR